MKLTRITKRQPPVQLRVSVSGELNAGLESYARYYQQVHGEAI